jgi:uncharacterized membrane protein
MPYLVLKFLHLGSMFLATALAIGPSILLYLIARTGNVDAIRRAFGHTTSVFRVGGALYGLGLLFGFLAALSGQIDMTARWLITAYVLVVVLIVFNLGFERWTRRIERGVESGAAPTELANAIGARAPIYALTGMVVLTLLIVFVMVVKPALF